MISPEKILLVDAVRTIINSDPEYDIETWELNTELAEFLKELPNRKIIVTNAPSGEKLERIKELLTGYDFQVYSLESNPRKTDPQYFETLFKDHGLEAERCFYFDHRHDNVESGKQAGIDGMRFESNEQIIGILSDI